MTLDKSQLITNEIVEVAARTLRYMESSGMCELGKVCVLCDCFDPETSDGYARLHARKVLEAVVAQIAANVLYVTSERISRIAEALPEAGAPGAVVEALDEFDFWRGFLTECADWYQLHGEDTP